VVRCVYIDAFGARQTRYIPGFVKGFFANRKEMKVTTTTSRTVSNRFEQSLPLYSPSLGSEFWEGKWEKKGKGMGGGAG